jgi:hypothetical protein
MSDWTYFHFHYSGRSGAHWILRTYRPRFAAGCLGTVGDPPARLLLGVFLDQPQEDAGCTYILVAGACLGTPLNEATLPDVRQMSIYFVRNKLIVTSPIGPKWPP